ncbi:MAG TPA: tRNA pseudouridine(55) synthase TruB [Gemmatimonadaceae bacterium]|jgi:tRNA pseudouridine 55 synthase
MRTRPIDGMLLVDKPAGPTSHDVVAVVRRALGERRIGHAGTLDPFATGLLVLLVGRATRLLPYIDAEPKEYEATVRFGAETDTDDLTGTVVSTAPLPGRDAVENAIAKLTGEILQLPPAYSAKKVGGRRAYAAARKGQVVALVAAPVSVYRWEVRAWREDEIDVTITCGTGTYVRSLARDVGRLAGSGAHLTALRRSRSGPFTVADAFTLDSVKRGEAQLRPALDAVRSLPMERLSDVALSLVATGRSVEATIPGPRAALVDAAGTLVAIAEREGDGEGKEGARWHPRLVLRDA